MNSRVAIPSLVRIKTGALARLGIYLSRSSHKRIAVFLSAGLGDELRQCMRGGLASEAIEPAVWIQITENEFEQAVAYFTALPRGLTAIVGFGGGKALDVAKY